MMALKPDLQAQRDGCSMHKPAQRLHARSCLLHPGCNLLRHLSSCPSSRATFCTIRSFRTCRAANEALHNATPPTSIEIGAHSARSEHDAPSQSPLRPAHIAQSVDERRVPAQWRAIPQQVQRAAHSAPSPAQPSVRALPQGNRRAGNSRKKASISTKQQPYRPAAAKGDKPGGHKTSESSHRAVWPGPSHAHLQPYWAALEAGTLHGSAAGDGNMLSWSKEEQRRLSKACQAAAAEQQLGLAVRLLQSQGLGLLIKDKETACHLLKGVLRNSQASMKQCLKLVRTLRPFGGGLYALLLASLAERKPERVERVEHVFDAMKADERIAPNEWDLGPWRLLLRSYGRIGAAEEAQHAFDHMRTQGIWLPGDTLTVNYLLDALSSDTEAAFERYVELREQGLKADLVTYNTLLKACMRSANLPCAEVIMAWLQQQGLQGSEYTYNTMVKVASYAGSLERALAVLDDMDSAGVAPTPAVWGSLLVACGKAGQAESAVGLWKRMRAEGAQPSTDQCNALLTACLDCQHNERALRLFQEVQLMGVQPDTVTYNLALKACEAPANNKMTPGLLETALGLLRDMKDSGVEPDLMTYTTLLGLCAQAGDGAAALALYEDVKARGVRVDKALLNALISALGSAGLTQEALAIFRSMVWGPARKRADQVTYRLMTRICREAGLIKEALHAYKGMRSCGFKPNNAEWQEVIAAAVEAAMSGDGAITAQEVAECLGLQEGQQAVDLHGLSGLEARAAVLCVLSFVQQRAALGQPLEPRLTFITGVGRHSDPAQGPVLHETVRKLLNEELHLATSDADRPNPGCLVINRATLLQWLAGRKHKAIGTQ